MKEISRREFGGLALKVLGAALLSSCSSKDKSPEESGDQEENKTPQFYLTQFNFGQGPTLEEVSKKISRIYSDCHVQLAQDYSYRDSEHNSYQFFTQQPSSLEELTWKVQREFKPFIMSEGFIFNPNYGILIINTKSDHTNFLNGFVQRKLKRHFGNNFKLGKLRGKRNTDLNYHSYKISYEENYPNHSKMQKAMAEFIKKEAGHELDFTQGKMLEVTLPHWQFYFDQPHVQIFFNYPGSDIQAYAQKMQQQFNPENTVVNYAQEGLVVVQTKNLDHSFLQNINNKFGFKNQHLINFIKSTTFKKPQEKK